MNELLHDSIRHNNWATKELIRFCREANLTEDQLATSGVRSFGGLLATLNHMTHSDNSYARALLGLVRPGPVADLDLADLEARAEETAELWDQLLSAPIDVERVIVVDNGSHEVRAGIFLAQALHHGNHHREQVCAILKTIGVGAPDLQAWDYAWATGRLWQRRTTAAD